MLTQSLFVCRLLASSTSWCVCMYLYVLGFSKHPSLLKVGVSKSPLDRIRTLEKWHGKCVSSVFYNMGKTYHRAEKLIHVLLEDSNVRVDGGGGTEFFNSDAVFDTVEKVVELCGGQEEHIELTDETQSSDSIIRQPYKSLDEVARERDTVAYEGVNLFDKICEGNDYHIFEDKNQLNIVIKSASEIDIDDLGRFFYKNKKKHITIGYAHCMSVKYGKNTTTFSFRKYLCTCADLLDRAKQVEGWETCYKEFIDEIETFYYLCSQYTGKFYEDNVKYIEGIV